MTAIAERASFVPARELPNGQPFYSPFGSFPFQAETVAAVIERTEPGRDSGHIPVLDTGMGKTVVSLAAGAFLYDEGKIDQMIVVVEQSLLGDWAEATAEFTNLSAHIYHGSGREKRLDRDGPGHVFLTSYETGARELMEWSNPGGRKGKKGRRLDGPLMMRLGLKDKRTFWVFDEFPKLKSRSSFLHKAYDHAITTLRRGRCHQRVLGLTATPMTTDMGDGFNLGLIACPERMPTIGEFESEFVSGHDHFGHPIFDREMEQEFARLFQGIITRKRKTDPDVAPHFPRQHESARHVESTGTHADFYEVVRTLFDPPKGEPDMRNPRQLVADENKLFTLLRLTAGHPGAHIHATNPSSKALVAAVGADELRAIGAPKVPVLLKRLEQFHRRGWPVVVFSFYKVILDELERELHGAGLSQVRYDGSMTRRARDQAQKTFKAGDTQVLLASDAAARGLNLQVSPAVIEYESALTFANRTQRINRVHRLTSPWSDVYCTTLICSGTIEDGLANLAMKRNEWQDTLLGDDEDGSGFVSAQERRALLNIRPDRRRKSGRAA